MDWPSNGTILLFLLVVIGLPCFLLGLAVGKLL